MLHFVATQIHTLKYKIISSAEYQSQNNNRLSVLFSDDDMIIADYILFAKILFSQYLNFHQVTCSQTHKLANLVISYIQFQYTCS